MQGEGLDAGRDRAGAGQEAGAHAVDPGAEAQVEARGLDLVGGVGRVGQDRAPTRVRACDPLRRQDPVPVVVAASCSISSVRHPLVPPARPSGAAPAAGAGTPHPARSAVGSPKVRLSLRFLASIRSTIQARTRRAMAPMATSPASALARTAESRPARPARPTANRTAPRPAPGPKASTREGRPAIARRPAPAAGRSQAPRPPRQPVEGQGHGQGQGGPAVALGRGPGEGDGQDPRGARLARRARPADAGRTRARNGLLDHGTRTSILRGHPRIRHD